MNSTALKPMMTSEQHAVWWATLSEDERLVAHVPVGYMHTLLLISYIKHVLGRCPMSVGERLTMLENLNRLVDNYITADVLATVSPSCNATAKMIFETDALEANDAFKVLTSWEVFGNFLKLNPTLLDAIKLASGRRDQSPASDRTRIQ
jgi:hypothetical protein